MKGEQRCQKNNDAGSAEADLFPTITVICFVVKGVEYGIINCTISRKVNIALIVSIPIRT